MTETDSYIAKCKCGCGGIVFAAFDDPERRRKTAQEIGRMIRMGHSVERMISADIRKGPLRCQNRKTK